MSGDLRAAVEGLPTVGHHVDIDEVLALIPEGAVLMTQETLAAAMDEAYEYAEEYVPALPFIDDHEGFWRPFAAAILRHLREQPE